MSLQEAGIEHKSLADTWVATTRGQFRNRRELHAILADVARANPRRCHRGAGVLHLPVGVQRDGR
jgi:hypothetical protein